MSASLKSKVSARLAQLGRNPTDAARRGGLERTFIVDILRGAKSTVRGDNLRRLAKALDCDPSQLLPGPDTLAGPEAPPAGQGSPDLSRQSQIVAEYSSVLEPDGTTTLPAEIRELWGLKPGDKVEFFQDHAGGWQLRPRNAGPLDFLSCLPPRSKRPDAQSDEEALTRAMAERNLPAFAKARK